MSQALSLRPKALGVNWGNAVLRTAFTLTHSKIIYKVAAMDGCCRPCDKKSLIVTGIYSFNVNSNYDKPDINTGETKLDMKCIYLLSLLARQLVS